MVLNILWYRMIIIVMGVGMLIVSVVVKRIIDVGVNDGEL